MHFKSNFESLFLHFVYFLSKSISHVPKNWHHAQSLEKLLRQIRKKNIM